MPVPSLRGRAGPGICHAQRIDPVRKLSLGISRAGYPASKKFSFPARLIRCKIASHPDVHMRKLLAIGTIAFVAFTMSNVPVLRAQALAELMPTGKIPPNKYKTYSLFLVCNPQWLAADKSEGLFALYQNFQNFGRTIGDENLAVWFINGYASKADSGIAAKSDVGRSVHFCQAWKLKP